MMEKNIYILLFCKLFVAHAYIRRLPCANEADFTQMVFNKYYNGVSLEYIYNISTILKCNLLCVTKNKSCTHVNYNTLNKTCELQANPSMSFQKKYKKNIHGMILSRTSTSTRQRGRICELLDPCDYKEICWSSCNKVGYICDAVTNIATTASGRKVMQPKSYSNFTLPDKAIDQKFETFSRTAKEPGMYWLLALEKIYPIDYLYVKVNADNDVLRISMGVEEHIENAVFCATIYKKMFETKLFIMCKNKIYHSKYIYVHGDSLQNDVSIWVYELKAFYNKISEEYK